MQDSLLKILLSCVVCLVSADSAVDAAEHPISITHADVYVTQTRATVRLTCFSEDLYLFQDLEANDLDVIAPDDIRRAIEAHKKFLNDKVEIRNSAGDLISGQLVNVQDYEIPEVGIEVGDLMLPEYRLTFQFVYEFKKPPEFITIEQNIADENFIYPSEMELVVKQSGSEQLYSQSIKPGDPHTIRFDWSNPPLSETASEKEWETWFNRQREATLGITSYSSVYSFIYLTDYEVRHEILVPLATLATIFQIDRRDENWLDVDEQDAAREAIKRYFEKGNPVKIDDVLVQPVFDRIDFHSLDLRDFAMQAPAQRVSMASGRVGIIISYSTKGTPNNVKVTWDKFAPPGMLKVNAVVFAFDELDRHRFSRYGTKKSNTYEWQNPGREPRPEIATIAAALPPKPTLKVRPIAWIGIGAGLFLFVLGWRKFSAATGALALLAGLGTAAATWSYGNEVDSPFSEPVTVTDEQARAVFETLHRNVYRAFDYGTEGEVYDALAASVSGELLRDLYLSIRKSLEVREQGGAMARIREVRYEVPGAVPASDDAEQDTGTVNENEASEAAQNTSGRVADEDLPWPGFRYRSTWTVAGTVEHWGHIHERVNRFDGIFTVQLEDGDWKITDFEVIGEKRIKAKTRLRKF